MPKASNNLPIGTVIMAAIAYNMACNKTNGNNMIFICYLFIVKPLVDSPNS